MSASAVGRVTAPWCRNKATVAAVLVEVTDRRSELRAMLDGSERWWPLSSFVY